MSRFLFKKIFILHWNVVDLQCCVLGVQQSGSIIHIAYIYSFSNSFPI